MKIDLKIPKGTKCKNGVCEQDLEIEGLEIPDTKPVITTRPEPTLSIPNNNQFLQQQQAPPPPQQHTHDEKPKKLSHEELAELIPKGVNVISCPGGDCGHKKLKNPIKTKRFKTCPNGECGANTVPKGNEFCPTCGKDFEEDEELDDGVILEDEEDDE
jgi:hypothetical protein